MHAARHHQACRTGHRRNRGFTLIECAVVCAAVGVLATAALPSLQARQLRAARADAVAALGLVQAAQEQHRSAHGLYADALAPLAGVAAVSPQARYAISVAAQGGDSYTATATAQGRQAADTDCPTLTLRVNHGFVRQGPRAACWNH